MTAVIKNSVWKKRGFGFVKAGRINKRIYRRTGFLRPTVSKWRTRHEETCSVQIQASNGRRKAKTPEKEDRIRLVVIAKPTTAQEIERSKSILK